MPKVRRRVRAIRWPLRRARNPRLEDLARRIDSATAVTREEGNAGRHAIAALAGTIEEHVQGLIEITDHLSARLDRAILLLERIESRLTDLEGPPAGGAVRDRA
jgi:hypothetical protein